MNRRSFLTSLAVLPAVAVAKPGGSPPLPVADDGSFTYWVNQSGPVLSGFPPNARIVESVDIYKSNWGDIPPDKQVKTHGRKKAKGPTDR